MAEANTKTPLVEAGAGWKRISKKGEKFLSVKMNFKSIGFDKDVEIMGFSNKNKKLDNHPDLKFYFSTPRTAATKPAAKATPAPATQTVPAADDDQLI